MCMHMHTRAVLMCTEFQTMKECSNQNSHKYKFVCNIQYYSDQCQKFIMFMHMQITAILMCTECYTRKECSHINGHRYKALCNIQYYWDLLSEFHYVHEHAHYSCSYVHRILHQEGGIKSKNSGVQSFI